MSLLGIGVTIAISNYLSMTSEKVRMKPLLMVGFSSYIVYLFHTTFMGFAKSFVHKIPMMSGTDEYLFVIGVISVVICGVVCPVLLHRLVLNRWKITKVLFGLR